MAWAEHEFRYGRAAPDGASLGDHEDSARHQLARLPAALRPKRSTEPASVLPPAPVEFPAALDYLWAWFCEITQGLAGNGFGAPVITWEALRAWRGEVGIRRLAPWEARALVLLGARRASILNEDAATKRREEQRKGKGKP